jgi:hypothetical protein
LPWEDDKTSKRREEWRAREKERGERKEKRGKSALNAIALGLAQTYICELWDEQ